MKPIFLEFSMGVAAQFMAGGVGGGSWKEMSMQKKGLAMERKLSGI